jgi:CRISPR/Cas system CMR-associated protein Cmr5 small subunit
MNTRVFYQYLFTTHSNETVKNVPDIFTRITNHNIVRSILRGLNLATIEAQIYGNHTQELQAGDDYFKHDYAKIFSELNHKYQYLPETSEMAELYKRLFFMCEILHMAEPQRTVDFEKRLYDTYKLMAYFGVKKQAEDILNDYDSYCATYPTIINSFQLLLDVNPLSDIQSITHQHDFIKTMKSALTHAIAHKILEKLGKEKLQTLAQESFDCAQMLKAVFPSNLDYLIKEIGIDIILNKIKYASTLKNFIETRLPKFYTSTFLMNIPSTHIQTYILNEYDIHNLLRLVDPENRFKFLVSSIGNKKLALCANSGYVFNEIVELLPITDRSPFIKAVMTSEEAKKLRNDKFHWKGIKSKLLNEDKLFLNTLVYTEEDLTAKWMLKNIKRRLQEIDWTNKFVELHSHYEAIGCNKHVRIPDDAEHLSAQMKNFNKLSKDKTTHVQALNEIKKHGQAAAQKYKTMGTSFSNLFFTKTEAQKYFESFDDDKLFHQTFGIRKKS